MSTDPYIANVYQQHQLQQQQQPINQLQLQQQYQNYQQNKTEINPQQIQQYASSSMVNTTSNGNIGFNEQIKQQPILVVPADNAGSKNITSSNVYLTLLGLADSFQQSGQVRLTIHCLESILTLKPNDISIVTNFHIQLKTRINLCRLYLKHTVNTNQYVNAHLEKSLNANDEYKYEATYLIYKIFQKQKTLHLQMKQSGNTDLQQTSSLFNLELIRKILETSAAIYPVWHLRLLFLISDILTHDRDFGNAALFMSIGIDFCAQNHLSTYTHILFILNKGLIHLLQRNPAELQSTMQPCASLIESFQTSNLHHVESLKIFFLVLQVTYFLQCGQMKSVRNTLKNLQHYVQSFLCRTEQQNDLILSLNPLENFQWLHKDHLAILVYLLTVVHSVQTGSYDKAQKLIEKALLNIQKLKLKEQTISSQALFNQTGSVTTYNSSFITNAFHFMFLENSIRSNISIGNRCYAIKQIGDLFNLCEIDTRLMSAYSPQLHCLLGIYCLSMNFKEQALSQFNQSLKSTTDTDLWLLNAMNSAVCYLNSISTNSTAKNQLLTIFENLLPENIQTQNSSLTAMSHYFRALKFYLNANYQQAKASLKEAILLSNSEELMMITANSYILMGHIDYLTGQFQESFDELNNGSEMAEKLCDMDLKIYSNKILKEIFKYFNDNRQDERNRKSLELEKNSNADIAEASKMPYNILIEWNSNVSPTDLFATIKKLQAKSAAVLPPAAMPMLNSNNNQEINQLSVIQQQHQTLSTNQSAPQQPNLHYSNMPQAHVYNSFPISQQASNNNSPVHQQISAVQQTQRLNLVSPQQQHQPQYQSQQMIQQQQQYQKMSPHQTVQNYSNHPHSSSQSAHHQHQLSNNHHLASPNYTNHHLQQQQQQHQQQQQYQQQMLLQQQQQQQQQLQPQSQQGNVLINHHQMQHR